MTYEEALYEHMLSLVVDAVGSADWRQLLLSSRESMWLVQSKQRKTHLHFCLHGIKSQQTYDASFYFTV